MRTNGLMFFSAVATATITLSVVACSSAPPDNTGQGGSAQTGTSSSSSGSSSGSQGGSSSSSSGGTSSSSGATSSSSSSSSGGSTSSGSSSGGQQDCSTTTDVESCYQCVGNQNQAGADKSDEFYFDCQCQAADCATQCAQSDCSNAQNAPAPTPGDACDTCEQKNDMACSTQADTQCQADATCAAFMAAVQKAGCDNKPEPPDAGM
jgi:hypothetical protein